MLGKRSPVKLVVRRQRAIEKGFARAQRVPQSSIPSIGGGDTLSAACLSWADASEEIDDDLCLPKSSDSEIGACDPWANAAFPPPLTKVTFCDPWQRYLKPIPAPPSSMRPSALKFCPSETHVFPGASPPLFGGSYNDARDELITRQNETIALLCSQLERAQQYGNPVVLQSQVKLDNRNETESELD